MARSTASTLRINLSLILHLASKCHKYPQSVSFLPHPPSSIAVKDAYGSRELQSPLLLRKIIPDFIAACFRSVRPAGVPVFDSP
ncbi:hypothetical protein NQZ68_010637 [Dissostichus eleginoides]|nr:hypothetical protein NQZ68_010637 [Dissostichus eleginoides]